MSKASRVNVITSKIKQEATILSSKRQFSFSQNQSSILMTDVQSWIYFVYRDYCYSLVGLIIIFHIIVVVGVCLALLVIKFH